MMLRRIARFVAPLPFMVWAIVGLLRGEIRWDYFAFIIVPPVLAYGSLSMKRLFAGIYPLGLVGLLYDAMRFVRNVGVTPERVHLCDLRTLEIKLFGIRLAGEPTTLHDWLQAHPSFPLDLYFAIPYGTFLFAYVGFAVFMWRKDLQALKRFGWCFLVVNIVGFATYHLAPAAPPWYFHQHGCLVDVSAHASEGPNLARVDAWLGFGYFHGMYGRAADVYGAIPSLHCAYPLIIALEGWPYLKTFGRSLAALFAVSMWGAAVYLDHHWIVDVVIGLVYGLATYAVVHRVPLFGAEPVTVVEREAREARAS
jgi:hypothetical protein